MPRYLTPYQVFNEKNEPKFGSKDLICFSAIFFSEASGYPDLNFPNKGSYIQIYQFVEKPPVDIYQNSYVLPSYKLAERWVNTLNKWGLPCFVRKEKRGGYKECSWEETETVVFTVKFDDYQSKNQMKLTCYFLRILWEGGPKYLELMYRLKDKFPKIPVFDLFQIVMLIKNGPKPEAHAWGYPVFGKPLVSLKLFKEYFAKCTEWNNDFRHAIWHSLAGESYIAEKCLGLQDFFGTEEEFTMEKYTEYKAKNSTKMKL